MNRPPICIRFATKQDVPALLSIYEPYIVETPITFEYEVPSIEEFTKRLLHVRKMYPYIVCELEGNLIAYAYAQRHKERSAYQWNVELSIYISEHYTSQGVGKVLYNTLFEMLVLQNVHNVYACITQPNEKSVQMHRALDFKTVGSFSQSGYKFTSWYDVLWMEKRIADPLVPQPFIAIQNIDQGVLQAILRKNSTCFE